MIVRVDEETHGAEKLTQIREVVRGYPGNCELQLVLSLRDGTRVYLRSNKLRVAVNSELRQRIDELLGPGYFGLITSKPSMPRPAQNARAAARCKPRELGRSDQAKRSSGTADTRCALLAPLPELRRFTP